MVLKRNYAFIVYIIIKNVFSEDVVDNNLIANKEEYVGEYFPEKYLVPEDFVPTIEDLNHYIRSLRKTVLLFSKSPNITTEHNKYLGLYFMKVVLKRTLQDHKLQKTQYEDISKIIKKAEWIISHYIYDSRRNSWDDFIFRISSIYKDDDAMVYSIENFNRNLLKKWIKKKTDINDYSRDMDNASLLKEVYVRLTIECDNFFICLLDSDFCIARVVFNPEVINPRQMRPCIPDPYCEKRILGTPSVAYSLSHRLANLMLYRFSRRCYFVSEAEDATLMESLCAQMYREAVYIARRGFFARDMFLEHIALCAMLGYEEFHRHTWFRKATSWLTEEGCIEENPNFKINLSALHIANTPTSNVQRHNALRMERKLELLQDCNRHPMALLLIVLAHAIRHTLHFMTPITNVVGVDI